MTIEKKAEIFVEDRLKKIHAGMMMSIEKMDELLVDPEEATIPHSAYGTPLYEARKLLWVNQLSLEMMIDFIRMTARWYDTIQEESTTNDILDQPLQTLDRLEDIVDDFLRKTYPNVDERIDSPLFNVSHALRQTHNFLAHLQTKAAPVELHKPCVDCGAEEANPGLDVCGSCYHRRIWGD